MIRTLTGIIRTLIGIIRTVIWSVDALLCAACNMQPAKMWAAIRGDVETMRRLIAFGADANAADDAGYTPLLHVSLRATLARARHWCAQSRCRCGRGEPSPGADVAGVSPVLVQMWQGRAPSQPSCGRGEPSPSPVVAGASPVPAQLGQG